MTMTDAQRRRAARERVALRRTRTGYAYDRAYYRATRRLIEAHRDEFDQMLAEERRGD